MTDVLPLLQRGNRILDRIRGDSCSVDHGSALWKKYYTSAPLASALLVSAPLKEISLFTGCS